jgi:hypothetical protein
MLMRLFQRKQKDTTVEKLFARLLAELDEAEDENAQLREVVPLAIECAGFGASLREAVDLLQEANEDLRTIEARYGVRRPSRQPTFDPAADFAALWSSLPDPN